MAGTLPAIDYGGIEKNLVDQMKDTFVHGRNRACPIMIRREIFAPLDQPLKIIF